MNAKEYLDSILELNRKIDSKQKELDKLNDLLYRLNKPLTPDKIQTSKSPDPLGDTISKIIDMQKEINNMIDEYVNRMREALSVIEQVKDTKEYDLLHKHYIQGMSWTKICSEWSNSNTWVHEVKRNAFESVQRILDGGRYERNTLHGSR